MIPVRLPSNEKPKRAKYRNRKVKEADGGVIDSGKEAWRKRDLQILERIGEIQNLRFQVPFLLIPKQRRADGRAERECSYIADAVYEKDGALIVEDTKSDITRCIPDYCIKRKLMLSVHGISITEI